MNLAIVIDPLLDGYGDLMFGYKLAQHEAKKDVFENIYLVSYKDDEAAPFFDKIGLPEGVTYLAKDDFQDWLAASSITVDVLVLGPEQYHHDNHKYYRNAAGEDCEVFGHTFMDYLDKATPLLLLEEYSYSLDNLQACKEGYETDGFTNVRLLRTGLEAVTGKDAGIFLDTPRATVGHSALLDLLAGRDRAEFKKDCVLSIVYSNDDDFLDLFFRIHQKFAAECCGGKEPKILIVGKKLDAKQLEEAEALAGADIVSVEFMPPKALESCYALADGLGGCTGDQSLSDTLSAGLIPIYDVRAHKLDVAQSLDEVLGGDNYPFMGSFFGSSRKDTYARRQLMLDEYADDEENFVTAVERAKATIQQINKDRRYNLYRSVDDVLEDFRCELEKEPTLVWYKQNKDTNRFAALALLDVGLHPKDLD